MIQNRETFNGMIDIRYGWDAYRRQYSGGLIRGLANRNVAIDCDARAIFCGKNGKPLSNDLNECSVYYANKTLFAAAAIHNGDNQTGGQGDSECIAVDLDSLPPEVNLIILTMDLFKEKKSIGVGKIQEAYVRLIDKETEEELTRVDIHHLSSDKKLVVGGRIQREENGWRFISDGTAYNEKSIEDYLTHI